MKTLIYAILGILIVGGIFFFQKDQKEILPSYINMKIEATAFLHNESIPSKHTCDGEGVSPELVFSSVPEDAQSLVLIMEDPDVPKAIRDDGMWDHWLMWNMPADTERIGEGETAPGTVGKNTGGNFEYGGPCPPDREHRYFFKLYALDSDLSLDPQATKAALIDAMEGHILDSAELIGLYNRQ